MQRVFAFVACLATVAVASADVKVVAKVTVSGSPSGTGTQTVTTCYKGSFIRTETDKTISIYNTDSQTLITMRKSDKTYTSLGLKDTMMKMPAVLAKLHVNSTADVNPTDQTTMIAGRRAKKYVGVATIQITAEGAAMNSYPTTRIDLVQWMGEPVTGSSNTTDAKPLEQLLGPLKIFNGMDPVIKAFSKMKGLPLSSRVTVTTTGGTKQRSPIVTTTEVQSIQEGPLADSLFAVPKGYKLSVTTVPSFPTTGTPPP